MSFLDKLGMLTLLQLILFLILPQAGADGLKCSLKGEKGEFRPHHRIEADLNGDGIKDIFYLAGEEDVFQTCVFLGQKSDSQIKYILKHEHSDFYDPVFNFDGSGIAQILVPSSVDAACGISPVELIPKELKSEIEQKYAQWSKGFEKYNFDYGYPSDVGLMNLYLLNEVKVFKFRGNNKIDVTTEEKAYLDLKRKILNETLKVKNLSAACRKKLESNFRAIN